MKLRLVSSIALVLFMSVCTAHTVFAISQLGGNPFYKPPLTSVDDLKSMVTKSQNDVKAGFVKAGNGDIFDAFVLQLPRADIKRRTYQKGQTFRWMFYRKGGKGPVRIDKNVVWESDTPFTGYEFFVDYNGNRYTFVVPPVCGNIALMAINPVPAPPKPEPAPVVEAPVPPPPPVKAAGSPFLFDVGYLHQLDPANYIFVRGGIEYEFTENFSLIGLIGGAIKFSGEDGESALLVDVLANYNCPYSGGFIGVGLGGWITSGDSNLSQEDSDLDVIVNLGVRIFGEPEDFNTSLFFEARSAVDEMDEFAKFGRFGLGLRFRF